jgi:tetratricopeptide (TPR) repeat protein
MNHRPHAAAEFVRKARLNAERLTDPNAFADAHYLVAAAQLWLGDKAGYRATCKALVDLPVRSANDLRDTRIVTPCLAENAVDDVSLPVKHAKEFIANNSLNQAHFGLGVLGFAHYRAGQYKQAAEHIKEAIAAYPSSAPRQPGYEVINYQRLFLAMTQWQLGQRDAARRLLAETQIALDQEFQSRAVPWHHRATFEVLRREAETLIGPMEADEAPKK